MSPSLQSTNQNIFFSRYEDLPLIRKSGMDERI
jgi:hypothetical protein